jgi:hypothetical protein
MGANSMRFKCCRRVISKIGSADVNYGLDLLSALQFTCYVMLHKWTDGITV